MGGTIIAAAIAGLGNIFSGIMGFKGKQVEAVTGALNTFDAISQQDKAYFAASAAAIDAVYSKGSWIERTWRPALMWACIGLVLARWFGYVPPGLSPTEVEHLYTFIYIGLGGYMPLRSLDKWMQGFQIGSVLKNLITKKLL